ncbi:uncharacterized protein LOC112501805 [Cynara cardunculus var. scolymus]|uniref:uncharacterized protein LOC112501805 n=1 Tax=Cynara cardunculus var. scolymus TaxID=59895 RepID=UPI000D623BB3|nr:uncharacterized protein LOC112501805 [Cynara cardunculus var. scolymus]
MDDARKFSLKDKIKQSLCFSCCFPTNHRQNLHSESTSSGSDNSKRPLFLVGASSQWIRSRATLDLPEIKHKCRNIFGQIGCSNGKQNHRRRRSSADFRYDPLSYALNFEEDSGMNLEEDTPLKDFSARLPLSPPRSSTVPSLKTMDHQSSPPIAAVS